MMNPWPHAIVCRFSGAMFVSATLWCGMADGEVFMSQSADQVAYDKIRARHGDTLEDHEALAQWCLEHGLAKERKHHLQQVIALDADHASARTALGYRRIQGKWMTREEEMTSRGMQMYQGRYRTTQEIELLESKRIRNKAEKQWFARLKMWRGWLDKSDKFEQTRKNILDIRDLVAVPALRFHVQREAMRPIRLLYIDTLAEIGSPAALEELVDLSLDDQDEEIRLTALEQVVRSGHREVVNRYIKALKSKSNGRVNRAAVCLRELKDDEAISPLIDALVTTHKVLVSPGSDPGRMNTEFSPDGGGSFSFGGSKPKYKKGPQANPEVLTALIALTDGKNFEYDQDAWKAWYTQHRRSTRVNARRD